MSDKVISIIHSRLSELESKRALTHEKLQNDLKKALMPLDAAIAELRSLLAKVNGDGSPPTQHLPPPSSIIAKPSLKRETVLSPKSKTPVETNATVLMRALKRE